MERSSKHRSGIRTEKAAPLFRQPARDFYHIPDLVLRGGKIVTDGCRRILDFTEQTLCLDMGAVIITLYGEKLQIESLSSRRLIATGQVQRIEFTRKWRGAEVCGTNLE